MARTMQTAPDTDSQRRRSGLRGEAPPSSMSLSRSARKQTTSGPASGTRLPSISDDEVPSSSMANRAAQPNDTRASHRHSTRSGDDRTSQTTLQRAQQRNAGSVDDLNRDDSDEDDDASSEGPTVRRQPQRNQSSHPGTSSQTRARKSRKVLKAVSTTAHRQRRKGFAVSRTTGLTSEEEQDDQQFNLVPADDLDQDDDSDVEGREGSPPRTRSVSIAGYTWKAQEVALRAETVVKALGYYRQRKIEVRAEKGTLLSGTDDGDVTDPEDPNFYVRSLKFKRGQLAYFLPDPEWLGECKDDGRQPMKPGDLEPDDWWLAVILDCAEVKYTDGSAACVLRVAWCYSPDQARELFASDPKSQWAKQLEKHDFWDNEMIASDHVDFVSAECSGGVYKGGVDQNAEEIALEIENQKAYDKAYEAYLKKYQKTPKKDRPRFVRPEPKVLPKHQDGKVCIRLMIRGLEESDLDRCSPKNRKFRRLPSKRWIEEIVDKQLDVFAEKWAALLSHEQRRRRFGLDTQIVRRTVASQDKRVAKEHQLHDLELLTSGYCGKGKGRGKTAIAARSSRPGVAMKRKASTGGSYSTGGKKVRKT